MPRLRRSDSSQPGISRRRQGRGFVYLDPQGRRLAAEGPDAETLERIRSLAIPPAWKDVWICPNPWGHLQALGTDVAGRKQYLYHQQWRLRRDQAKFEHMIAFGRALPRIRRVVARHLRREDMSRERVLACAVRLLDLGFFRVGSEDYAELNETYGLATMLKRHVRLDGGPITFNYVAKGGKRRLQTVVDRDVHDVVAALKRRTRGGRSCSRTAWTGGGAT